MVLDYIALAMLIAIIALMVYGLIAVWGIPYEIAKARNHPHQDAIGAATWVSLFHARRALAVPVDLGDGLPARTGLGRAGGSAARPDGDNRGIGEANRGARKCATQTGDMMGTILVLGYAALCVLVFKILRMPVNRWTITTAAVSGV